MPAAKTAAGSYHPPMPQAVCTDPANPGGFRHIPALDGIRGLAILLILGDHLLWANSQTGSAIFDALSAVRASLWIGVNLFFALSGFLITGILWDTLHQPHFFRNFYARRSLRIFPLYYGTLLILLLLTRVLHIQWNGWQYFYLTYTANIAIWRAVPLITPHVNINHFWSLQVEEQFYLLWPLVVYRLRNQRRLLIVAFVTCAAILALRTVLAHYQGHFTDPYLLYAPTFSNADNLLFGCALALLLRTSHREKTLATAPKILAYSSAALLAIAIAGHGLLLNTVLQQTVGMSLVGIASTALIAMALVPASPTARLFDTSLLRFFGRYSYGLYVFHYTLDTILTAPCRTFLQQHTHSKAAAVLGGALIVAAASVAVAVLSYHLYEIQFLKLKRFFSYRRTAPAAP